MATKTPNFNLNKTELTDTIQSTILANNDNFDKIDEALKNSGGDCNIPKFVGTEENPIDFSNLFEGIGNATDGWYQGNRLGQCLLEGYVRIADGSAMMIGDILQPPYAAMTVKDVLVSYTYAYDEGMPHLLFQTMFSENFAINFNAIAGVGFFGGREDLGVALKSDVLEKSANDPFTPTLDYHPATKKYVDDEIAKLVERITALEGGAS